jgi:hypothetical protein
MKTLFWTFFVLTFFVLTSCATQKKCNYKYPCLSGRDSIYIETIDTFKVSIPGDTIINQIPINCPDQDILIMENGKLSQSLKIVNGLLKQKLIIKPDTVTLYTTKIVEKVKEVTIPKITNITPRFWIISGCIGIISVILIIVYLGFKMRLMKI